MRLFLAIELPSELLDALQSAIEPLHVEAPELAWVPAAKRHLTLKFLGEVLEHRVDHISEMIDRVAATQRPFGMNLGGVGAFPNFRRARVLWIGVEHEARLELLHHDLEVAADALGFELEGRAFRPHVTLARVRTPLESERIRKLARAARRIDFVATAPAGEITLFESMLAPGGARYRRVHAATLSGGR